MATTWDNQDKSSDVTTDQELLIEDAFRLQIDGTYFLQIQEAGGTGITWTNETKN